MSGRSVSVCLVSGIAPAQESKTAAADQEAIMKKWMEFMTPGAEHELLKYKEGNWKFKMEMWMAPGTERSVSEGTSEMKLILGDVISWTPPRATLTTCRSREWVLSGMTTS